MVICPQFYFFIEIVEVKEMTTHKKRTIYEGNFMMIITDHTVYFINLLKLILK